MSTDLNLKGDDLNVRDRLQYTNKIRVSGANMVSFPLGCGIHFLCFLRVVRGK